MRELITEARRDEALGELEALLFAASSPLSAAQIARRLYVDEAQARELLRIFAERLREPSRGLQIRDAGAGWRLETKPEHSDVIASERAARREKPLSAQALEVLAVIALAEPVTTDEVSKTRGAESYAAIETLRRHGLVAPAESRGTSGKATRWRTTQRFLGQFGLRHPADIAQPSRPKAVFEEANLDPSPD